MDKNQMKTIMDNVAKMTEAGKAALSVPAGSQAGGKRNTRKNRKSHRKGSRKAHRKGSRKGSRSRKMYYGGDNDVVEVNVKFRDQIIPNVKAQYKSSSGYYYSTDEHYKVRAPLIKDKISSMFPDVDKGSIMEYPSSENIEKGFVIFKGNNKIPKYVVKLPKRETPKPFTMMPPVAQVPRSLRDPETSGLSERMKQILGITSGLLQESNAEGNKSRKNRKGSRKNRK